MLSQVIAKNIGDVFETHCRLMIWFNIYCFEIGSAKSLCHRLNIESNVFSFVMLQATTRRQRLGPLA